MSPPRNQIFGVDFSGASSPGRTIWITEAQPQSNKLHINDCRSAMDLFDLSPSSTRDEVYNELQNLIKNQSSAVFGFDFPFSLPEPLIDDVDSWREHIETFPQRFGNKPAEEFRKISVGRATAKPDESGYLRRETDWRYGGQCPYQPQTQYQTLHGQRDLLSPMISNDEARALPMQAPAGNFPWLVEVYPAATLSALGLYRLGYKSHPESSDRRLHNIDGLRNWGAVIGSPTAKRCRDSDDAHDSVIAAVAVFRTLQDDFQADGCGADIEGQIFV